MKDLLITLGLSLGILFFLPACKGDASKVTKEPVQPEQPTGPEWPGTYVGKLPCADCEGIYTSVTLMRNYTYRLTLQYIGKNEQVFNKRDKFSFSEDHSTVILEGLDNGSPFYKLGNQTLTQLDLQSKPITGALAGHYILRKKAGSELDGVRWNLTELMGKYLGNNPAYVMFDTEIGMMTGFGWCNNIRASVDIQSADAVDFGTLENQGKVCGDSIRETQFLNLFNAADHFEVRGKELSLYRTQMRPLAVFKQADIRMLPQQQ